MMGSPQKKGNYKARKCPSMHTLVRRTQQLRVWFAFVCIVFLPDCGFGMSSSATTTAPVALESLATPSSDTAAGAATTGYEDATTSSLDSDDFPADLLEEEVAHHLSPGTEVLDEEDDEQDDEDVDEKLLDNEQTGGNDEDLMEDDDEDESSEATWLLAGLRAPGAAGNKQRTSSEAPGTSTSAGAVMLLISFVILVKATTFNHARDASKKKDGEVEEKVSGGRPWTSRRGAAIDDWNYCEKRTSAGGGYIEHIGAKMKGVVNFGGAARAAAGDTYIFDAPMAIQELV
mmetsp:Transcript_18216/g.45544  ORF Transcript_18216/g.45544 Transcript_18216/m.45544 type:complete len:288 (+) Transcript_18216:160-1023(+)|eukprot:g16196.t1